MKIKTLFITCILVATCLGQGMGGNAGQGGKAGLGGGAPSSGGGGTVTFVQIADAGTNANCAWDGRTDSNPCPLPNNTAAGNTIIGCVGWNAGSTGATFSITSDTQSLSWSVDSATRKVADSTTDYTEIGVQCFHSTTTTSAGAETVTLQSSVDLAGPIFLYEIHGSGGTVTYQTGGVGTGSGTSQSTASVTPTQNGALIIAISVIDDGTGSSTTYTQGSGWTLGYRNGGGDMSWATQYLQQATAAGVTGPFTTGITGTWVDSQTVLIP